MEQVEASGGIVVSWGVTHRHNGVIVSRQASIAPPSPIQCVKLSCLWDYLLASLRYTLIMLYHKYRVRYAESHRDNNIPEHYRMGEPSPNSIWAATKSIIRLKMRR